MLDKETFLKRIELWIAALRSGKYKQGRNGLHNLDSQTYCCLGVACEVSSLGHWSTPTIIGFSSYIDKSAQQLQTICLTQEVKEFYGLTTYIAEDFENELIRLNDSGEDFESIATWIENSYKVKHILSSFK